MNISTSLVKQVCILAAFSVLFLASYYISDWVISSQLAALPSDQKWISLAVLHPAVIAAVITILGTSIVIGFEEATRPAHLAALAATIILSGYQVWTYQAYFVSWPYFLKPSLHLIVGLLFTAGGLKALLRSRSLTSSDDTRRVKEGVFGDAAFATVAEMKERFGSDGEVVIGEAYIPKVGAKVHTKPAGKAPLLTDDLKEGSTHGVLIAGSGGYKTTSVILPTLWAADHSCVVFDPKKELAKATQRVRRAHGKTVHCLDPSSHETYGFNALDWVEASSPTFTQDLLEVASWIVGETPQSAKSANQFFQDGAKNLIHVFLIDIMTNVGIPEHQRTLAALGDRLGRSEQTVRAELEELAAYSDNTTAKRIAASLSQLDSRTFSSVHTTATSTAGWLFIDNLVGIVSAADFTTAEVRNQKADLFIQTELQTLTSHPGLGRVMLGALFLPMFRIEPEPGDRVIFLLDEVARLGHLPILETARDVGRSAGITLILMYQSHGQFADQWGREGTNKWFENVAWRSYGAVGDYSTAEIISKSIGDYTVMSEGQSKSAGSSSRKAEIFGSSSRNQGQSTSEQRRRLINPDEILAKLSVDSQFIFVRGMPPIFAGRAIYFRREDMTRWID